VLGFLEDKSGAVWVATAGRRPLPEQPLRHDEANAPLVDLVPVLVEDDEDWPLGERQHGGWRHPLPSRKMDRMASIEPPDQ
jgi:hypothetical protein